jgi:hypothetical protein
MFWGDGSISHCEKRSSHEHVSNSEWSPRVVFFESPGLTPLYFGLWGWMRSDVYKRDVDIRDELLARILVAAAARIKKPELHLRRTKRDLRTR